ncbi:MAG: 1-deoxy-D-xylulose-5-phosphate synthase, partial [Oscillospiraceae bacterium]|nr:1-deoxy-D-xylulose-5-phosphate synthase [Oscillospiraceae bacterium]
MEENSILAALQSPAQLRGLEGEQLRQLAGEIRRTLIKTVSENGGHLSSNLGVVELTLALHLCFDSPE